MQILFACHRDLAFWNPVQVCASSPFVWIFGWHNGFGFPLQYGIKYWSALSTAQAETSYQFLNISLAQARSGKNTNVCSTMSVCILIE